MSISSARWRATRDGAGYWLVTHPHYRGCFAAGRDLARLMDQIGRMRLPRAAPEGGNGAGVTGRSSLTSAGPAKMPAPPLFPGERPQPSKTETT